VDHARANGIPENVRVRQARRYAAKLSRALAPLPIFTALHPLARFGENALYDVRTVTQNDAVIEGFRQTPRSSLA